MVDLLHLSCLYVLSHGNTVSSSSYGSSINRSRGSYGHKALASEELNTDFGWRIWGGHFIHIEEAPYTVLYGWYCGGTLVASNWVLTAAHCDEEFEIHAGANYQTSTEEYAVKRHVYHPNWFDEPKDHYFDHDYLLLELEVPVPDTEMTRPIAIGGPEDLTPDQVVSVSGWGESTYTFNLTKDDSYMSGILNSVEMTVLDHNDCVTRALPYYGSKFGKNDTITPRMVCAEGREGAACFGDSGGPVVANNKLVGVVSWGIHCEPILVFSNVVMAKDWISSTTGLKL